MKRFLLAAAVMLAFGTATANAVELASRDATLNM